MNGRLFFALILFAEWKLEEGAWNKASLLCFGVSDSGVIAEVGKVSCSEFLIPRMEYGSRLVGLIV